MKVEVSKKVREDVLCVYINYESRNIKKSKN